MRAFALDDFGGEGSVHDLPVPEPAEGQVQVRVAAASLNPADVAAMNGAYKQFMECRLPFVPGLDHAGVIEAVGPGVSQWKVGDQVFGGAGKNYMGEGTLAEVTTVGADAIARRPEDLDVEHAAALPLAAASAVMAVDAAELQAGDVVAVLGAAGGIGGFTVQLASDAVATVVAVTRAVNEDYVRGFGAAELIDHSSQDVVAALRERYPDGIAALIHLGGDKEEVAKVAKVVREEGRVVSLRGGADVEALQARRIKGVNIMSRSTTEILERILGLIEGGVIQRPEIKTFPLDRAGEAYAELAAGHVRGKLVITI